MAVTVTFLAHGMTNDHAAKIASGWNNSDLIKQGMEQCLELRNQIDVEGFDAVFCSDLRRAVDSAYLIFGESKEIFQDFRLRECNYGDLNGADSYMVRYEDHITVPFPNGESLMDVESRIRDFCDYLLQNFDGKHVAVISHKAPQIVFQVISEGTTFEDATWQDWRETNSWLPGWTYIIHNEKK